MTIILQISDPHLMSKPDGTLKGVPTSHSLDLVLERARRDVPDPDRVVISGDLSHEHTVAGYELLKRHLGDWADRSLLIPGNHDDRRAMRSVFEQVPGKGDDDVWFRDEVGDWLLIGLDSHVPGEVYGELSDTTLDRLADWLSEPLGRPTLIFLHHPPAPVGSPWIDKIGLRNPSAFEQALTSSRKVRGIFCGHIHQVFEGRFANAQFLSAPSTAFQFAPQSEVVEFDMRPPGFRVIELQEHDFSTRIVRLDEMPFVPGNDG